jgi:hypothetical protein
MHNRWLVCFLCGVVLFGIPAWGQSKPTAPPQSKNPAAAGDDDDDRPALPPSSATAVASDAAVLTIKGLCPDSAKASQASPGGCQTVITRAEFEKVASAIQPSLSPRIKRQLESLYPRLLIMSHEAEVRGLDKEEYIQQMVAFARMQILTQQLTRRVQEEAGKVPEQEFEDYYKKNPESFTQYSLERIYIPRSKQEPPPAQKLNAEVETERQRNAESEMTKLADALRARAASGEAFEALQKEAYQSAGVKSNPPNANMGKMRRTGLPPGHEVAFSLKAGEVSQVLSDAGGHYIYKMDSVSMETFTDAKDEIHNVLQTQRTKEFMDKIQGSFSTEVNDAYFGNGPAAGAANGAGNPKEAK